MSIVVTLAYIAVGNAGKIKLHSGKMTSKSISRHAGGLHTSLILKYMTSLAIDLRNRKQSLSVNYP